MSAAAATTAAAHEPQQQSAAAATAHEPQQQQQQRWALAIHGGAGVINSTNAAYLQAAKLGLQASLEAGQAVLAAGGSALDAVVAAVVQLEDDPAFNAGVGSVLCSGGHHELEASVMCCDGRCGAVTLLKRVHNPVVLAKQVMERTPHIFLSGSEAEAFAQQQGHILVDNSSFTTEQRRAQWERYRDEAALAPADEIVQQQQQQQQQPGLRPEQLQQRLEGHGQETVGAVAIDAQGRLAAATSTGGRTNKWDGRIGDTPLIGAGTWCDGRCALSGTGVGEEFIRRAAAHDVAARLAYKRYDVGQQGRCGLQRAMDEVVHGSGDDGSGGGTGAPFAPGDGGFVGVDSSGNIAMAFNSGGMFRGSVDSSGRMTTAIFPDDEQPGAAV